MKIKEKIGMVQTKVLMTDDYPAYYNAWEEVIGPSEHRLMCLVCYAFLE